MSPDKEKNDENKSKPEATETTEKIKSEATETTEKIKPEAKPVTNFPIGPKPKTRSRGRSRGGRNRGGTRKRERIETKEEWIPNTRLGELVKQGKVTSFDEVLSTNLTLNEPQIIDFFLKDLKEDILEVNMVQRMSDSGRRTKFAVTAVIGNADGYIGIGRAHAKEVGEAIRKAIKRAKLNIIHIKRGCGSWQCDCDREHSVPFKVKGKSGSTEITLLPAPQGLGVVSCDIAKRVLALAGIRDVWTMTKGETRTKVNMAYATHNALKNLISTRGVV